ncbi:MAG: ATP-binding protein [Syntrophomonas sp.]
MKSRVNSIKKSILVLTIGVLLLFCISRIPVVFPKEPRAEQGVLDLRGWDFTQNGPVQLNGEWEFYWHRLLTKDDFRGDRSGTASKSYINVPDVWNHYGINGVKLNGKGFGTYRLRVRIDEGQEKNLGLKILTMSTSYKMMLDNKPVASAGTVGTHPSTASPRYKTQTMRISPSAHEFEIIVQVANYTYARGGIWRPILMGTAQQMFHITENSVRREMFVLGVMAIMLFYHFFLYWIQKKNRSMLYVMLGLLIIGIRILVTGEYYITGIFPDIPFSWVIFLEYNTVYWGTVAWLMFLAAFYPEEFSRPTHKICLYIAMMLTVITLVTPVYIYTGLVLVIEIYTLFVFMYSLLKIIQAVKHHRHGAKILLFCVIVILAALFYDVMLFWSVIKGMTGGLLMLAVTVMILLQAYVIAERYARAFNEAEEYSRKMEYVDNLKDAFLANTSHELRTPLNGIISITESIIYDQAQEVPPVIEEKLNLVVQMGHRLSVLVKDVLDFSIMKNNKLLLEKNSFTVAPLIDNVLLELEWKAKSKNITINNEVEEESLAITADKYRIIQVLYNLLDNAVKFTPAGGHIVVRARQKNKEIAISVVDDGMGIPADQLEKVFEPFEHGEPVDYIDQYGGLGLGLNISKAIAQAHGGDILVSSRVGKGSEFTLVLPVGNENNENYREPMHEGLTDRQITGSTPRELVMKGSGKECIVVIDDQYSNLAGVAGILHAEGYTVKGFTDPVEGLTEILLNRKTDMAIVDLMMPRVSGYEICQRIREQFSLYELPVLILTAKSPGDSTVYALGAGANDVLYKPFDREELLARVGTLIHLKTSTEQAIYNEVAMLQAQINPHFLHNAMNALAACCYEDAKKACNAITALSDYLRYSFDLAPETKEIPLVQEIALIKNYLAVEKLRFGDRLCFDMQFQEPENLNIPPFVIQPLVENAVRHGISKKENGGLVGIYGERRGEDYYIAVEDNGPGITNEAMSLAMSGQRTAAAGIGLSNVGQRLKKRYGTDLKIESELGRGTRVSFSIQVRRT